MHCGVMVSAFGPRTTAARPWCRTPRTWTTPSGWASSSSLSAYSIWATEHYGSAYSMQPNPLDPCGSRVRSRCSTFCSGAVASTGHQARHLSARVRVARAPDRRIARVLLRREGPPRCAGPCRPRSTRRRWVSRSV